MIGMRRVIEIVQRGNGSAIGENRDMYGGHIKPPKRWSLTPILSLDSSRNEYDGTHKLTDKDRCKLGLSFFGKS